MTGLPRDQAREVARTLTCCGGTLYTDKTTEHEPWCASIIRAALSWTEETRQGEAHREKGLAALDALLARVEAERARADKAEAATARWHKVADEIADLVAAALSGRGEEQP